MINIGIVGYGNVGRGVKSCLIDNDDMQLIAIFTRRNPSSITTTGEKNIVTSIDKLLDYKNKIDVLILCGGSATDLPIQSPEIAKNFNFVDSYDNHKNIPSYFNILNTKLLDNKNTGIISVGWDPGLFSLMRLYSHSILPSGKTQTFWGYGVSQGHSDAIRRIDGVKKAIQYTKPINESVKKVRNGIDTELTTREKHTRHCYVVVEENADIKNIENKIKSMPNYFEPYDTFVEFISEKEFDKNHSKMPHGGFVIHSGSTTSDTSISKHIMEFSLKLDSNPEFTASVLLAYARACARLNKTGKFGAHTVFDIAPNLLAKESTDELMKNLL